MYCKICAHKSLIFATAKLLSKYQIEYFKCTNCGFIQTEEPYWLEEAYQEPINISDTGIVARNIYLAKITANVIYFLFDRNAYFLDYAGGYGLLTRLMRDIGFNFYWYDPFTRNLFARGFESLRSVKYELITSFESFEHFVNPLQDIEKMLAISKNILFTTELIPNTELKDWWYFGFEHGQHISFYSLKTLSFIASKYGLNLHSNKKGLHLLTERRISPKLFKLLYKLNGLGYLFVKMNMKGKTFNDHEIIKRGLQ
jgi:hypothetical protein